MDFLSCKERAWHVNEVCEVWRMIGSILIKLTMLYGADRKDLISYSLLSLGLLGQYVQIVW